MQPERHAAGRDALDQRVRELVRQHAFELGAVLQRALHRHADAAIERAARPLRRLRDVAELLARVEHDRDDVGGIGVERRSDSPVRALEDRDGALRELRFGRPFEQDGEVIAQLSAEAAVKRRPPCARRRAV